MWQQVATGRSTVRQATSPITNAATMRHTLESRKSSERGRLVVIEVVASMRDPDEASDWLVNVSRYSPGKLLRELLVLAALLSTMLVFGSSPAGAETAPATMNFNMSAMTVFAGTTVSLDWSAPVGYDGAGALHVLLRPDLGRS